MIGKHTENNLENAIESEYDECVKNHGGFKNHHEAIAVLAEEMEEVVDCFKPFERTFENEMAALWSLIRADQMDESAKEHIYNIRQRTLEMVKEGIQVCAVCDKWDDLIIKENEA